VACRVAAWVAWAAWAAWTTKSERYKLTQAINHSRVSQEARLFCCRDLRSGSRPLIFRAPAGIPASFDCEQEQTEADLQKNLRSRGGFQE
jgi:hypothetical protein